MQVKLPFLICLIFTGCATSLPSKDTMQWHPLGDTNLLGISGIAAIDKERFLVVHDAKRTGQLRLGIVTWQTGQEPSLVPLAWCGDANQQEPVDLEAITAIPNQESEYLVLESNGNVRRIHLDGNNVCKTTAEFPLPTATDASDMEALALHCFMLNCVLFWAERGDDVQAAKLSWAKFDVDKNIVDSPKGKPVEFTASYPSENHRSISDLAIDSEGVAWVSATSDPGDDGPFLSALYQLGTFSEMDAEVIWTPSSGNTKPIAKYENSKIEGISFIDNKLIMATDDENKGSKIAVR